jgi:hypothetical protein
MTTWLVGSILPEHINEWPVQRARYVALETIVSPSDNSIVSLPTVAVATWQSRPAPLESVTKLTLLHHVRGHDLLGLL